VLVDLARLPAPGECHLWAARPGPDGRWSDFLSPSERVRAAALAAGRARDVFTTSRGLQRLVAVHYLRTSARGIRIVRDCAHCGAGHGRPRLAVDGLDYSVAHTRSWVVLAAVSEGLVGADLDEVPNLGIVGTLAPRALTPCERNWLQRTPEEERPAEFLRLWVRKEAVAKLTGHGISAGLGRIDVRGTTALLGGNPPAGWPPGALHLLDAPFHDGHLLALAATRQIECVVAR